MALVFVTRQPAVSMATSASHLVAIAVVSARLNIALKGNQATRDGNVKSNFGDAPNELVTRTTLENGHGRIQTRSFTACGNVAIVSDRHYRGEPESAR
jgi:hypothetical protein